MPTTIFLILAAWSFARSSPRLEAWLLQHPRFGPTLVGWRETGAVSRPAKIAASIGMTAGFALFWVGAHPGGGLLLAAAMLRASAFYVVDCLRGHADQIDLALRRPWSPSRVRS